MRYVIVFCGFVFFQTCYCQDIHFSQFYNAPLSLSSALVGSMEEDQRIIANYRNQWSSVPVPYETLVLSYDQKLQLKALKRHWIGVGGQFIYDQAGDADLNWLQLALHSAFHLQVDDQNVLSAGIQARVGQRALEAGQLNFGDQYVDNFFDPAAPTQEAFGNTTAAFTSLGTGLGWSFKSERSRTRIWAGASAQHLNRPTIQFAGDGSVSVPMLINAYAISVFQLNSQWDMVVNVLNQFQGTYQENILMTGGRYHFDIGTKHPFAVQLSGGYRLNDAVIAYLDIFYQNWRFGLSYDINTSPFRVATNRNGGPELSVQYLIRHVSPPKEFKICPIF